MLSFVKVSWSLCFVTLLQVCVCPTRQSFVRHTLEDFYLLCLPMHFRNRVPFVSIVLVLMKSNCRSLVFMLSDLRSLCSALRKLSCASSSDVSYCDFIRHWCRVCAVLQNKDVPSVSAASSDSVHILGRGTGRSYSGSTFRCLRVLHHYKLRITTSPSLLPQNPTKATWGGCPPASLLSFVISLPTEVRRISG